MKQRLLASLLVGASLALAPAAFAAPEDASGPRLSREEFKKLTPEQREKFHAERKEKWEKLSRDEKLKVIDQRHEQFRKEKEDHWKSLSDDDKLKRAEERMERGPGKGPRGGHRGPGHDGDAPPRPEE